MKAFAETVPEEVTPGRTLLVQRKRLALPLRRLKLALAGGARC